MDDLISRQAAVELAMKYCPDDDGAVQCDGDIRELLDELENLPLVQSHLQPTCNQLATDCISRQAALKEVEEWRKSFLELCHNESASDVKFIRDGIEKLPSAQPEQKTATWLIRKWGDDAKCSNCGHTFKDVYDMDNHDRFCRFCGSKMVGVKMYEISDRKVQGM